MRCGCRMCNAYMIQAESAVLGCVCPSCGYRCTDCLGTDTAVPRDRISALAQDARFSPESLQRVFAPREEEAEPEDEDHFQRDGGF